MLKKCNFCDRETRKSRNDFNEIDWMAIQLGNDKMICACYEHHKNLMKLMEDEIKLRTMKVQER